MKRIILILVAFVGGVSLVTAQTQSGIGTKTPTTTLEVIANATDNTVLDGKSTLTAAQRANFESLFGAAATLLPQTSGNGQNTATYLGDIDGDNTSVGNISGDIDNRWSAASLPNHTHTGTTSSNGNHSHGLQRTNSSGGGSGFVQVNGPGSGDSAPGAPVISNGDHTHTMTTNAGNGLGGAAVNTAPRTLDVNHFVYLGN